MQKRHNGEGCWTKITRRGKIRFRYRVSIGNGKSKDFTGNTQREALEKYENYVNSLSKPLTSSPDTTVGEIVENYVRQVLKPELTPRGYDSYEAIIRTQFRDLKEYDLYNVTMQNLDKEACRKYVDGLIKHGYAPKTIKKVAGLIKAALKYAVEEGKISSNPMDGVKLPSIIKTRKTFLTKNEVIKFYDNALHIEVKGDRYNHAIPENDYSWGNNGLALALISQTGMRVSEMIALTWDKVDLKKKLIHIDETIQKVGRRDENGEYIRDHKGSVRIS